MPNLSLTDEQSAIVTALTERSRNAIVNAVAGSGKTRTALATAIRWLSPTRTTPSPRQVALLTYNKRLQQDMLAQRDDLVPTTIRESIHIRTIHSFAHRHFGGQGITKDGFLSRCVETRATPTVPLPRFGLVIVDEAQDLTPVTFQFLHYVISLLDRPHLLVLGDPFQLLYRFKGADESYIVDADTKFADVAADTPFEYFKLSVCFRITHEMAEWINTHLNPNNLFRAFAPNRTWFEDHKDRIAEWWGQGISADPARPPAPGSVVYYRRNKGQGGSALGRVVEQIKAVFEQFDMQSSALLSPTIGENAFSPVRLITNDIKHLDGVQQPWFFDSSKLPGAEAVDLSRNKRVASTIHKFKGRERDAIVLVGLDDFAEIRERVDPRNVFSMFYVGATRARQHLLIIQWSDSAYATHQSRSEEPVVDNPFEKPFIQVERMLQFCPYNKLLCEESDECLQSRMIGTVPGISLVRDDYLVSGAHTPRRLRTVERVLEIIGTGVNIRLQLLLDDGVLQVPSEEEDTQMPIDLSFFLMRLRNEAKNRTEEYSWGEVLEIATAFLTVQDQRYSRWRQVRDFSRWPVVRQSGKLDEMVRNLVRLLNMAAAHKGEEGISTEDAARMSRNAIGGVAYDRMVERLKRMRREKMIEFHLCLKFDMQKNSTFVRLHSSNLVGVTAIMLLSERVAERFWQLRESDVKSGAEWNGDGMTFVEVSISNRKEHDDLLEVGCLGAMQRERNLEALVHSSEVKMAKLFVAYPHVGELIGVKLHMNSFEFLHRLGFRKINRPFDAAVLGGVQHEAGEPVPGLV